jgi:hypothetical protein
LTGQKVIDRIEKNPLRVQIIIAVFIGPFPVLCDNGKVGTLLEVGHEYVAHREWCV